MQGGSVTSINQSSGQMDERSWYGPKALRISHEICPQTWQQCNDSDCTGEVWPLSTACSIDGQDWMAEVHGGNVIKGNTQHSREDTRGWKEQATNPKLVCRLGDKVFGGDARTMALLECSSA